MDLDTTSPLLEEEYHSEDDEDFNPDQAPADAEEVSSSDSDDEDNAASSARKITSKRKQAAGADLDFDNSGDEATIQIAKKRKKKRGGDDGDDEEEGGEGGLVKTRAQRRAEKAERKALASTENATVDVDALWANMTAGKPAPSDVEVTTSAVQNDPAPPDPVETITIIRTFNFAGETTTETKTVPKDSAEAKLYLAEQAQKAQIAKDKPKVQKDSDNAPEVPVIPFNRPKRRPSRFDPNPSGEVKALPPEKQRRLFFPYNGKPMLRALDPNAPPIPVGKSKTVVADKLNTVDKSRLDWAGYVDQEGIAEELDEYGKAKEGYFGRQDFLQRVGEKREEARRGAGVKG